MIKHWILQTKTKTIASNLPVPAINWHHPSWRNSMTQAEYETYMETFPFDVGDYITLGHANVRSLTAINRVLSIERDASKLRFNNTGAPSCMFLLRLETLDAVSPFGRWDNAQGYREINEWEMENLIQHNDDKIQNHIKKWRETTVADTTS